MKRIFLASPLHLTTEQKNALERMCLEVTKLGAVPIAPALYVPTFLDIENDASKINQVITGLIEICQEYWYVGSADFYQIEIVLANQLGLHVVHLEPGVIRNDYRDYVTN